MSNFLKAMQTEDTKTTNGMTTNSSSGSYLVDFFFKMGAARELNNREIINSFISALNENSELTMKALFYNRDIRGGQGERNTFRILFHYLCVNYPKLAEANIHNVVHYGRWDDLLVGLDTPIEKSIAAFIFDALSKGDKLCAKWMPRENKSLAWAAKKLMELFDITPRNYRKLLANNTEVVENLMCASKWGDINYNHIPSMAINKYRSAFYRNDGERFKTWVEMLKDPKNNDVKINAGAIFPHNIVRSVISSLYDRDKTTSDMSQEQWNNLPNYMPEGYKILPVCDVSGSMNGTPIEVCIALGIYLSERNTGPFKDMFMTFSNKPKLQHLTSESLSEKIRQLHSASWGMNTNLEACFKQILNQATKHSLSEEDMPDVLLILSDMQFDQCVSGRDDSAIKMIHREYKSHGYKLPQVIFWNLNSSVGVPVRYDEKGTALVSGFSPSIMQTVLSGEMNPMNVLLQTLNSERYNNVITNA